MPQSSLTDIARQAQAIAAAETAVVALAEKSGETIFYAAAVGKHAEAIVGKRSQASTSGLCGAVFASGQAELVCHTRGDLRVRQDLAEALGITTALAAPITRGTQLLGALMVLNRQDGGVFDDVSRGELTAYAEALAESFWREVQS